MNERIDGSITRKEQEKHSKSIELLKKEQQLLTRLIEVNEKFDLAFHLPSKIYRPTKLEEQMTEWFSLVADSIKNIINLPNEQVGSKTEKSKINQGMKNLRHLANEEELGVSVIGLPEYKLTKSGEASRALAGESLKHSLGYASSQAMQSRCLREFDRLEELLDKVSAINSEKADNGNDSAIIEQSVLASEIESEKKDFIAYLKKLERRMSATGELLPEWTQAGLDKKGFFRQKILIDKIRRGKFDVRQLSGANLRFADLHGLNMKQANFTSADLTCANLSGADLRGANLSCAHFEVTDIYGANFKDAQNVPDWIVARLDSTGIFS
ncbi:pentapeptide repeat-containing protein [Patescibacteria group bacterium]|nr:pentapeptide repeat-containing protein [Patescibacteria group bacterium]